VGGSVHVTGVAAGLAALGHDVHVVVTAGDGPFPDDGATWLAMAPPLGSRRLRWMLAPRVGALAARIRPDAVIERYYNFGGEGVRAARAVGALTVLEVNAPVIDHPRSGKSRLDRALLVEPMRRWRDWQCRRADLFVTPCAEVLPAWVPADRVIETEWGADTVRFTPDATGDVPFARRASDTLVVFAGAFRAWHGAVHLVHAIRRLREHGREDVAAVLIGSGPELGRVRAAAERLDRVTCVGAVPHDVMPACLAAADIGAAPFDVGRHPPLSLTFFWSPLKLFEYMAAGLPVVAPAVDRIGRLVRDGREGLLYDARDPGALAASIDALRDSARRRRLGTAARRRVVESFGWSAHCRRLASAMEDALDRRRHA
jgi:glycosyltransferase involved in cell wall biosynthesis